MKYAIEIPFQDTEGRPIYVVVPKPAYDETLEILEEYGVNYGIHLARNMDLETMGLPSSHQLINEPVEGGKPREFRGGIVIE